MPTHRFSNPHVALREIYGYSTFRGVQEQAIASTLNGEDVFVLMATGGGKSLCYIVPPLVDGRAAVVVSPLVSLMQDQVCGLTERGVSACYLGSAQPDDTVWQRLSSYQLIYVTPEMTVTSRFRSALKSLDIMLLAVDEAHCVSEWGHDFRPEYRRICELRDILKTPVVAVTATATRACQQDIVKYLGIRGPVLITSVDRPNLNFSVMNKSTNAVDAIRNALPTSGSAIVYVPTVREADDIANGLRRRGIVCESYHAGNERSMEERKKIHDDFTHDRLRVVVATLAFGMGVDKPDVRAVLHWGMPKTLEAYYQQAGRAGRDGDTAVCTLFHGPGDFMTIKALVGDDARALQSLSAMRTYCDAYGECRRNCLVRHFDEVAAERCGRCDVCLDTGQRIDLSDAARRFLLATEACQSRCGVTTVIGVLKGATKHDWLRSTPPFGSGKDLSVERWRTLYVECRAAGLVEEDSRSTSSGHSYAAVKITDRGRLWLEEPTSSLLGRAPLAVVPSCPSKRANEDDETLMARLTELRTRLAQRLPPYMVCSNDTLRQLVDRRPTTEAALLNISGFGKIKVEKYGDAFLEAIRRDEEARA